MKKHGASHGLAVLVCTITSGLLLNTGYNYYPDLVEKLEFFAQLLVIHFHLVYQTEIVANLILSVILAVIWGIAFACMHSDKKSK